VDAVLERAVDRALVMFFPTKEPASHPPEPMRDSTYNPPAWTSSIAGGPVEIDASGRRLLIRHGT
jgi:hypothetical protein